jgi:O-antigen/teichoic acid export membrane protein
MIPNVISWWLISAADRYIILYFLHSEANGIYAISTRFPTIVSVINSVFMLAWQDHAIMSKDDNIDNTFITDVFHRFVKFELSIVIFLISVSQFVVIHLIDKKFVDSWHYMPFLYLAVAFASFSAFVGVGHQKAKKTFGIFTTTIIGAVLNIVISIALIKHLGLYATGIGSFISFAAVYLIRLHQAKNYFEIKVDHKMLWSLTGLSIIITIINLTGNRVMILACIGISVILMIWLNKYFIDKGLAFIGKMGRNKIALRT